MSKVPHLFSKRDIRSHIQMSAAKLGASSTGERPSGDEDLGESARIIAPYRVLKTRPGEKMLPE
jgi:hypothetical protein